jgi:hypothetical protein
LFQVHSDIFSCAAKFTVPLCLNLVFEKQNKVGHINCVKKVPKLLHFFMGLLLFASLSKYSKDS